MLKPLLYSVSYGPRLSVAANSSGTLAIVRGKEGVAADIYVAERTGLDGSPGAPIVGSTPRQRRDVISLAS